MRGCLNLDWGRFRKLDWGRFYGLMVFEEPSRKVEPSPRESKLEKGTIIKVSGPLVVAEGLTNSKMFDLVRVSKQNLPGEIIEIKSGAAYIQVYEDTTGIGPG